MEIEHEVLSIEDLFLDGKDTNMRILITIPNRGDFEAYVTPVTYGQIKKMTRTSDENEIADYVLQKHFFRNKQGDPFTVKELNLLPAGVLKGVVNTIMEISGLNLTDEDIRTF